MKDFHKKFLKDSEDRGGDGSAVVLGAFGKHPAWDDHADLINLATDSLRAFRELIYLEGISRMIEGGEWSRLDTEDRLARFHHRLIWRRGGQCILALLLDSSDGRGRREYPYILCAHVRGRSVRWALTHVLPRLEEVAQSIGILDPKAIEASLKQVNLDREAHQVSLREEIQKRLAGCQARLNGIPLSEESEEGLEPMWIADFASSDHWGVDMEGFGRIVHQTSVKFPGYLASGDGASGAQALNGGALRVPAVLDQSEWDSLLWLETFRGLLRASTPVLIMTACDHNWSDVVIGEPSDKPFFGLKVGENAVPKDNEIPYRLETKTLQLAAATLSDLGKEPEMDEDRMTGFSTMTRIFRKPSSPSTQTVAEPQPSAPAVQVEEHHSAPPPPNTSRGSKKLLWMAVGGGVLLLALILGIILSRGGEEDPAGPGEVAASPGPEQNLPGKVPDPLPIPTPIPVTNAPPAQPGFLVWTNLPTGATLQLIQSNGVALSNPVAWVDGQGFPAGSYVFKVTRDGWADVKVTTDVIAGETRSLGVSFAPGKLVASVRPEGAVMELKDASGQLVPKESWDSLAPGEYRFDARLDGYVSATLPRDISIRGGETTHEEHLLVAMAKGVLIQGLPPGTQVRASGPGFEKLLGVVGGSGEPFRPSLPEGRYFFYADHPDFGSYEHPRTTITADGGAVLEMKLVHGAALLKSGMKDASVFLNGKQVGVGAEVRVTNLVAGPLEFLFRAPGMKDQAKSATIVAGRLTEVNVELKRPTGTLKGKVDPADAALSYKGRFVSGKVPLGADGSYVVTVPVDTYHLTAVAKGLPQVEVDGIRILEDATTQRDILLPHAFLSVSAGPEGARFLLNDQPPPAQPAPWRFPNPTDFKVWAELDGYIPQQTNFTLTTNMEVNIVLKEVGVLTNSLGMLLQWVPAVPGGGQWPGKRSQGAWVGRHEVTQGQYMSLLQIGNPSLYNEKYDAGAYSDLYKWSKDYPVEKVSVKDAKVFLDALNQKEAGKIPAGWSYQLPTVVQWQSLPGVQELDDVQINLYFPGPVTQGKPDSSGLLHVQDSLREWAIFDAERREANAMGMYFRHRDVRGDSFESKKPFDFSAATIGFRVFLLPTP